MNVTFADEIARRLIKSQNEGQHERILILVKDRDTMKEYIHRFFIVVGLWATFDSKTFTITMNNKSFVHFIVTTDVNKKWALNRMKGIVISCGVVAYEPIGDEYDTLITETLNYITRLGPNPQVYGV